MEKENILKKLLIILIVILSLVLLSIPTIVKSNSKEIEYQNKIQNLEREISELKDKIQREQTNKLKIDDSINSNNTVEEKSDNNIIEENVEEKTEVTQESDSNKDIKIEYDSSANQESYIPENTSVITNTQGTDIDKNYNSITAASSSDINYNTDSNINNTSVGSYYILNKSSKKFHIPTCRSVKQMKESNKMDFYGTRDEAISQGYSPCGNCNP